MHVDVLKASHDINADFFVDNIAVSTYATKTITSQELQKNLCTLSQCHTDLKGL